MSNPKHEPVREDVEREAFEANPQFKYMEFDRDRDAWGRGKYKHSHVQAIWEGWKARAAAVKQVQDALDTAFGDGIKFAESVASTGNTEERPHDKFRKAINDALSGQARASQAKPDVEAGDE